MRRAVLKFGGDVVADVDRLKAVLGVVARYVARGWRFCICHGGGPQISSLTRRLGLAPHKVGGRRVTDSATLDVVKQVLAGEVNVDVTAAALAMGLRAVGVSGISARLVDCRRRPPMVVSGGGGEPVDFGFVGAIEQIRTELLAHLWDGNFVPVMSTLGVDPDGQVYNINADTVASAVAGALQAEHLFLMTSVGGVFLDKDDPTTRLQRLTAREARQLIADGRIAGGMIPKVEEALKTLTSGGGAAVHILGSTLDALEAEIARPGSAGTVLLP